MGSVSGLSSFVLIAVAAVSHPVLRAGGLSVRGTHSSPSRQYSIASLLRLPGSLTATKETAPTRQRATSARRQEVRRRASKDLLEQAQLILPSVAQRPDRPLFPKFEQPLGESSEGIGTLLLRPSHVGSPHRLIRRARIGVRFHTMRLHHGPAARQNDLICDPVSDEPEVFSDAGFGDMYSQQVSMRIMETRT